VTSVGLPELVAALGGELIADPVLLSSLRIDRIDSLESARPSSITFLSNPQMQPLLASTAAGCVVVGPAMREAASARGATIVVPDPYLYYARLTQWWVKQTREPAVPGVHATAVIDPSARVAASASIGPLVVIGADAVVGEDVVIGAQSYIGRGATIGRGTRFHARVTFGERCSIGARGVLNHGVAVGGDGFGFAPTEGRWEKIEQLGAVRIGDDADIGANTCIDRGALDDTVIGNGVKIDNLVQIAHNCRIGDHTAIAGCVGIAGGAVIGKNVMIGGAAMIGGHLEIADNVFISGAGIVSHSVRKAGRYSSAFPLDEHAVWQKNAAVLRGLSSLRDRLRTLEKAWANNNNKDSA
jgi:UDP-3-O-[3-hydroxymyristoyl] glucosamine N-acyltransferase